MGEGNVFLEHRNCRDLIQGASTCMCQFWKVLTEGGHDTLKHGQFKVMYPIPCFFKLNERGLAESIPLIDCIDRGT